MRDQFSRRHGLAGLPVGSMHRDVVPVSFRKHFLEALSDKREHGGWSPFGCGLAVDAIGKITQEWDEGVTPDYVCRKFLQKCPWYHVFDLIEAIFDFLAREEGRNYRNYFVPSQDFEEMVNPALIEHNIGWQLRNGKFIVRGDEVFEGTIKAAGEVLNEEHLLTAADHIHHSITALSSRPKPNTAGAVAHATSAVECVLGEVTGQPGLVLTDYLKQNPSLFHGALKKGLEGIYGYASDEGARHGKEGTQPTPEDAEFVVATCAALCTLLARKHGGGKQ